MYDFSKYLLNPSLFHPNISSSGPNKFFQLLLKCFQISLLALNKIWLILLDVHWKIFWELKFKYFIFTQMMQSKYAIKFPPLSMWQHILKLVYLPTLKWKIKESTVQHYILYTGVIVQFTVTPVGQALYPVICELPTYKARNTYSAAAPEVASKLYFQITHLLAMNKKLDPADL